MFPLKLIAHTVLFICLSHSICIAQPSYPANAAMRQLQFDYNTPRPMPRPRPFRPMAPGMYAPGSYSMAPSVHPPGVPPFVTAPRPVDPPWTQHLIPQAERSFDFQTVVKGTKSEHKFVLKNKFVETMHIASVTSSCTCATPIIQDGKNELQTHEEAVIVVHFHTDRFDGRKNATITVSIDRPYRAEIQLNIRGEIRSDISIAPSSVQFGPVKEGEEASRTLTVVYTGRSADWRLVDVADGDEHLSGEILDTQARPGQITTKVKIRLAATAPPGDLYRRLRLISNDTAQRSEIPLIVQARVGTTISVTPSTVFFGYLKPGEASPVKTVSLRGTQPFRITKLFCENPEVRIQFVPDPDATAKTRYLLPIQYANPPEGDGAPVDGKMKALVEVETDNPKLSPRFNVTMELAKPEAESEP